MGKEQLIEDIKIEMENLERLKHEMKILLEKKSESNPVLLK